MILGIDTSTVLFSVCLCEDENILYEIKQHRLFSSGNRDGNLFNVVNNLTKSLGNAAIKAIALALGPGLYTSLRVGLALAKGIHFSSNIPIFGVNTLDVVAESATTLGFTVAKKKKVIFTAVIDAFQKEFFVAFYDASKKVSHDFILTAEGFLDYLERSFKKGELIIVAGPGSRILKKNEKVEEFARTSKNIIFLDSDAFLPSASKVVRVALPRIKSGKCDNPEFLEPYYIRKSDAGMKSLKS